MEADTAELDWYQCSPSLVTFQRRKFLGHGELSSVHSALVTDIEKTGVKMKTPTREVCVKEITWSGADRKQRLDSQFEQRQLAAISHPCIVRLYAAGFVFRDKAEMTPTFKTQDCHSTSEDVRALLIEPSKQSATFLQQQANESTPFIPGKCNADLLDTLRDPSLVTQQPYSDKEQEVVLCVFMELCTEGDLNGLQWDIVQHKHSNKYKESQLLNSVSLPTLPRQLSTLQLLQDCHNGIPELLLWVFMAQLVLSLCYLHCRTKPVLHRDLKPANQYLREQSMLALGDFGIAIPQPTPIITPNSTSTNNNRGNIVGTPAYQSPELQKGDAPTSKCDIWSAGCVLFELAKNHQLFQADNIAALSQLILDFNGVMLNPELSFELNQFLATMLVKDVDIRPDAYTLITHPYIQQVLDCLEETFAQASHIPGGELYPHVFKQVGADIKKERDKLKKWGLQHPEQLQWTQYLEKYGSQISFKGGKDILDRTIVMQTDLDDEFHSYDNMVKETKVRVKRQSTTKTFMRTTEDAMSQILSEQNLLEFGDTAEPANNPEEMELYQVQQTIGGEYYKKQKKQELNILNDPTAFAYAFSALKTMHMPAQVTDVDVGLDDDSDDDNDGDTEVLNNEAAFAKAFKAMKTGRVPVTPVDDNLNNPEVLRNMLKNIKTAYIPPQKPATTNPNNTPSILNDPQALKKAFLNMKSMYIGKPAGQAGNIGTNTFLLNANAEIDELLLQIDRQPAPKKQSAPAPVVKKAVPSKVGNAKPILKKKPASKDIEDDASIKKRLLANHMHSERPEKVYLKAGAGKNRIYAHEGEGKKIIEKERLMEEKKKELIAKKNGIKVLKAAPVSNVASNGEVKPWKLPKQASAPAKKEIDPDVLAKQKEEKKAIDEDKKARVEEVRRKAEDARAEMRKIMQEQRRKAKATDNVEILEGPAVVAPPQAHVNEMFQYASSPQKEVQKQQYPSDIADITEDLHSADQCNDSVTETGGILDHVNAMGVRLKVSQPVGDVLKHERMKQKLASRDKERSVKWAENKQKEQQQPQPQQLPRPPTQPQQVRPPKGPNMPLPDVPAQPHQMRTMQNNVKK